MRTKQSVMAVLLAAAVAFGLGGAAQAALVTMTDGDTLVEIDPDSSAGVFNWQLGETTHLAHQWFWFRNNLDDFNDREYSLEEISAPVVFQPIPRFLTLTYAEPRLSVEITYVLTGGSGGMSADLAEIIHITNLTDDPMVLNLFQYSDFDLGGDADDDRAWIEGGNTAFQTDLSGPRITLSETIASGSPELSEVAVFPTTFNKLINLEVDDLDGTTELWGPADLTWAFQWKDRVIQPGHALMISKDKVLVVTPVPEPATIGLVGLGLLLLGRKRS